MENIKIQRSYDVKKTDKKKTILVFDTETVMVSGYGQLVFDIGCQVVDKKGTVYASRSMIISDTFLTPLTMNGKWFYGSKLPAYSADLAKGKRAYGSFRECMAEMFDLVETYKVKEVAAYNLAFDLNALRNTSEVLYGTDFTVFLETLKRHCIWRSACNSIYGSRYIDFCIDHEFFTPKGNISTKAENGYRYISDNPDFVEAHTGLADVKIEVQILTKVYGSHKKIVGEPVGSPWIVVEDLRRSLKK